MFEYCSLAGNVIDIMLTHDHDDNSSSLLLQIAYYSYCWRFTRSQLTRVLIALIASNNLATRFSSFYAENNSIGLVKTLLALGILH